jgi:hypothetical protein
MNHSNRDRTPVGTEHVVERLTEERATASPLELDRLKLQAMRQAERTRPSFLARQKGAFMKSRLAMMLVIAAGFMLSTTGAGLAISGTSGSGSAAQNQYQHVGPENGNGNKGQQGVKGVQLAGGEEPAAEEPVAVEALPAEAEQVETTSGNSSLPFTGFLAIPLLLVGLVLLGGGALLRSRMGSRHS